MGCGSATPTLRHFPSCQVIDIRGKLIVLDCGEGCQVQMRKMKLGFSKITNIFISHLHGDHCFGLPGLLSTMAMNGRIGDLNIYGPLGIKSYIDSFLQLFGQQINYKINTIELPHESGIVAMEDRSCIVSTLKLNHRIPCIGYLFTEKKQYRRLNKEMADFYKVPISSYNNILNGEDFLTSDGDTIPNKILTSINDSPRKYAYLSDTTYQPELIDHLNGVTTMYHETTFLMKDKIRAYQTGHSTTHDAANIAKKCNVQKNLLIGHYSARYSDISLFEKEAKEIFERTIAVNEGNVFDV